MFVIFIWPKKCHCNSRTFMSQIFHWYATFNWTGTSCRLINNLVHLPYGQLHRKLKRLNSSINTLINLSHDFKGFRAKGVICLHMCNLHIEYFFLFAYDLGRQSIILLRSSISKTLKNKQREGISLMALLPFLVSLCLGSIQPRYPCKLGSLWYGSQKMQVCAYFFKKPLSKQQGESLRREKKLSYLQVVSLLIISSSSSNKLQNWNPPRGSSSVPPRSLCSFEWTLQCHQNFILVHE